MTKQVQSMFKRQRGIFVNNERRKRKTDRRNKTAPRQARLKVKTKVGAGGAVAIRETKVHLLVMIAERVWKTKF